MNIFRFESIFLINLPLLMYPIAKKNFGQHFLNAQSIAEKITLALNITQEQDVILEIGPGTGVLTDFLFNKLGEKLEVVEIDRDMINIISTKFPNIKIHPISFLDFSFSKNKNYAVIGNFPYNISTQIVFKIIENKENVSSMVGMFQKEVAKRICSDFGSKEYGILSVLTQAFFDVEYLFTVLPGSFTPPPKVNSGVIRITKKENIKYSEEIENTLFHIVKMSFNQRRKTIRNALKSAHYYQKIMDSEFMNLRAEQLHYKDFIELCYLINE